MAVITVYALPIRTEISIKYNRNSHISSFCIHNGQKNSLICPFSGTRIGPVWSKIDRTLWRYGYGTRMTAPIQPYHTVTVRSPKWTCGHPSLNGKQMIVQTFVGGYTQFLVKAQGMPKEIATKLDKIIQSFVWDGKRPKVKKEIMRSLPTKGGKSILDISARNTAIEILWLKDYLKTGPNRPRWANLMEDIIHHNLLSTYKSVPKKLWGNMFLQTWEVKTQSLPPSIRTMIKIAWQLNVVMPAACLRV